MYEIIETFSNIYMIKKTDDDGVEHWIPEDEGNSDYQQYLIDTDGGLPVPEEQV